VSEPTGRYSRVARTTATVLGAILVVLVVGLANLARLSSGSSAGDPPGSVSSAPDPSPVRASQLTDPRPLRAAYRMSPDWVLLATPPIRDRWPAVLVSTGTEIIVFGGEGISGGGTFSDGAIYDLGRDEWRILQPAPIAIGSEPGWVWTGSELIVWDDGRRAAAFDPVADTWRVIDPWPLAGSLYARAIWTGEEIIDIQAGLAVDGSDGSSRRIAEPPAIPDSAVPVWTGELIVLSTGGFAYRPDSDEWIPTGSNALNSVSTGAAWTGRFVVAVDYEGAAARFDPATAEWLILPPTQFDFGEWIPWTHNVADTVAVETWAGVLVYQPTSGAWTHFAKPTVGDRAVQLIPVGDDLYGWDGGLHRLMTAITEQPRRAVLDGVIVDRPPSWETLETSTTRSIEFRTPGGGSECSVVTKAVDALQPSEVSSSATIEIQPVVGGKSVPMVVAEGSAGVTLSWSPSRNRVVQVQCSTFEDARTLAAHTWIPWQ